MGLDSIDVNHKTSIWYYSSHCDISYLLWYYYKNWREMVWKVFWIAWKFIASISKIPPVLWNWILCQKSNRVHNIRRLYIITLDHTSEIKLFISSQSICWIRSRIYFITRYQKKLLASSTETSKMVSLKWLVIHMYQCYI